ncbi:bifunctional phosphopantothenoylcysteine decarboxylase/phosphopantothenate--cysteine ligase CoaBC [Anaerotignum sp. MSJ-24]|uniref:bifunctional phosphopantothenoylcysteine decarboxylase/phosphopantothenate--cysteine ligase CoaBC n=1 Tax=Anaerotignum sp. MSJ-24 TaxID=2841521 RepID=UPI001C113102|nr:bifunctional phosphopantothenoylcysteine decarboxylase/phosphopantothenate--cysteine ligase CoaBC [Anaerotignum sp. MSJ-24]MBU5463498.1 bifunctional phosphopantothenoylcysteine decarboxylase/phosphopantothenate--cysteine ligase CoaBC [Anaerotignum sp. MSJ-24]
MLKGKTVVLGVTGSIAAYKMADVASMLVKQHAEVHVIMTANACNFINPITFETLTSNKCLVDTFDRDFEFDVKHISLAKKADVFVVAPASANIIGKIANGIADDMLSTTIMAAECTKLVAPAMNTRMYHNRIVQDNIAKLKDYGYEFIAPASGHLACGDNGDGKLADVNVIFDSIVKSLAEKDLIGKKFVITAGPTREAIDPVRFISNRSTGKMGYALAKRAALRGADVVLISGPVSIAPPDNVKVVNIESAEDMFNAVVKESEDADVIIKSAAVADYRPVTVSDEKIKKENGGMNEIKLERTKDILAYLGEHKKDGQILCGFSMETQNLMENSVKKLNKKNADMIVANSIKDANAGFGVDTNIITIITKDDAVAYPVMTKDEVADEIINAVVKLKEKKNDTNA